MARSKDYITANTKLVSLFCFFIHKKVNPTGLMVPTPTRVPTTTAHSMDYLTANTKLECLQIWRIPKMLRCDLKFRQLLTVDNELLHYVLKYIFRSSENEV